MTRAGGACTAFHVCAPRTRATSLSPRPIRGLFWPLNGGTGTLACVLCTGGISLGHRQECLCHISRVVHEGFFHRFRVSIDHCQIGAHRAFWTPAPLLPFLERARAVLAAFEPQRGDLPQPRPLAWVERPMHFN